MPGNERHGRARYRRGCRCDQCKCAESEYQKARRQRIAESVGELAESAPANVRLLHVAEDEAVTSGNAASATRANTPKLATTVANSSSVVAAVREEINALGACVRPGLAAAAMSLAAVLDNPRATSSKPAAAGALVNILNQLRKSAAGGKPKLAAVRALTSEKSRCDGGG